MEYECSNGSRMIIARSRCSIDNKRTEEWIGSNSRAGRRRLSKNFDDESVNNTAVFWMRTPLVTAAPLSRNRGLRTNAYTCVRVQHAPITRLITPDHLLAALVRQNIMLASLSLSLSLSQPGRNSSVSRATATEQFIGGEFAVYPRVPSIIDLLLTVSPRGRAPRVSRTEGGEKRKPNGITGSDKERRKGDKERERERESKREDEGSRNKGERERGTTGGKAKN